MDAASLVTACLGFLTVWAAFVLLHGIVRSLPASGDPLPPADPHHHDDHP